MKKDAQNIKNSVTNITSDSNALLEFVMGLNDKEVEKLSKRIDLFMTLRDMSEAELLYGATFFGKLFGKLFFHSGKNIRLACPLNVVKVLIHIGGNLRGHKRFDKRLAAISSLCGKLEELPLCITEREL